MPIAQAVERTGKGEGVKFTLGLTLSGSSVNFKT